MGIIEESFLTCVLVVSQDEAQGVVFLEYWMVFKTHGFLSERMPMKHFLSASICSSTGYWCSRITVGP